MESIDEMRLELERVINKSSVWPDECVGKVMCCVSEKVSRRLRKGEEDGQSGVSTWMLKSPVMMSSEGDVAKSSSKVANSERKIDLEDEGGRYIVSRMNDRGLIFDVVVKRTQSDSKEV